MAGPVAKLFEDAIKNNKVSTSAQALQPSGTTNAGFRQVESSISSDIAKKAADFDKKNKNTLNPFVPQEAFEMAERKKSYYHAPEADDWKITSFAKRLANEQQAVRTMDKSPFEVSTGNRAADTVADLLGFGLGLVGPGSKEGGALTSAAGGALKGADYALRPIAKQMTRLAEAGPIGKATSRGLHGIAAGGAYGTVGGITQDMNARDTAINALQNALLFGGMEFGLSGLGTAAKGIKIAPRQLPRPVDQDLSFIPGSDKWGEAGKEIGEYRIKPTPKQQLALPPGTGENYSNIPNFELPSKFDALLALEKQKPKMLPSGKKPLALPRPGEVPNFETVGKPRDTRFPQPKTFTGIMGELKPEIETLTTPPMERTKALVDFIYEGMDGQISKNEIRKMNYEQLASMAQDLAKQRKSDLWGTTSKLASNKGYDLDNLYKMETDPAYAAERLRVAEVAGLPPEAARFKKEAPPEIQAKLDEASEAFGWKKKWAPEAMKSERFQAANELSKALTGREIITYTSYEGEQGFAMGRQAFLNARSKQPTLYIASHEITHTMETSHPEYYGKLKGIVIEHVADDASIIKHYVKKYRYDPAEVPDELTADILAECMVQKSFWERVRNSAPELLKPILDTIDHILTVAKKQAEVPGKYEMMKYMKDVEVMRDRLAVVYKDYMKAAKEEQAFVDQFGSMWQDSAAKAKGPSFKLGEGPKSPLDDVKAMVEYGSKQLTRNREQFAKALQGKFPEAFAGYEKDVADRLAAYVFERAGEYRKGATTLRYPGGEVEVKRGGQQANPIANEQKEASPLQIPEGQTLLEGIGTDPAKLKDIAGVNIYARDMWRNAERVFGDKFPQFKARYLDPLEDAKAKWVDHQRALTDDLYNTIVDGLGIKKGSRDSEMVQLYGEGGYHYFEPTPINAQNNSLAQKKWLDGLEKKYGRGNVTLTDDGADILKPFTETDLVNEVGAKRAADIVEAENWFREKYDTLIDEVNRVRAQIYPNNPDKIVPKRKDYFRHFREMEGLEGLSNLFDTPAQISPELAGKSMFTRPKTKFQGFMQQRGAGKYKPDAVGGFLDYVPAATFSIHIDPQAATFRSLENELAKAMGGNPGINNFLTFLKYFADDVQGKTNPWDRNPQEFLSRFGGDRLVFTALDKLNGHIKGNMVLGNAGTVVSQAANIPQGLAFAKQHSGPGLTRYLASLAERGKNPDAFAKSNPMAQSRFLKERYSGDMYRRFETKTLGKLKNKAAVGLEDVDRFATEFTWNSCYEKAMAENIANPVRYADFHTRKLVAGRGIGEVPIMQKSKLFQLIAPFQVEVGNLWHVMGDMTRNKDYAGLLIALPLSLWLFNRGSEMVKGSPVTFDPLQAIIDAGKIVLDDQDSKAYRATGRLAGEALSNIPLGQTAAAMLFDENERKQFFGREDPTRFGSGLLVAKGIKDPLFKIAPPFGGSQLEKTAKGIKALGQGGAYTDKGQLKYPVGADPLNAAKGLVFGPSAFRETPEYYNNNRRPLSERQTQEVQSGAATYKGILDRRQINAIKEKWKNTEDPQEKKQYEFLLLQAQGRLPNKGSGLGRTNIKPNIKPNLKPKFD